MGKSLSASKDALAIVSVGFFSLLTNIFIGVFYEIPVPKIHDEFAYLLSGETFAAGRLTNPTHPMWQHFETFHVFHVPTYQTKYPPAQGLFIALGTLLTARPILGVWISLALAYSATCWMLLAVFPRPWAFYGSMLAAASPNMLTWWGQSYWGGAVAMLGGALLFGAVFRFRRRLVLCDSLLLGLGIGILANSRPLEGAIICFAATPIIIASMRQWILNEQGKRLLWRFGLPLAAICLILAVWLLLYNYELTGNVFTSPYENWNSKEATHEIIRSYRGSPRLSVIDKLLRLYRFFVGPILLLSMLGFGFSLGGKKVIFSLGTVVCVVAITLAWPKARAWPHYIAPISCLIFVIIVHGLRSLSSFRLKRTSWGRYFVIGISIAYFTKSVLSLGMRVSNGPRKDWAHARTAIIQCLENQGSKDLIMVRYSPRHNIHREWVYNSADIDNAEVVWARELSPRKNKQLFEYFRERNVWLLLADMHPPHLLPYTDEVVKADEEHQNMSVDIRDCSGT